MDSKIQTALFRNLLDVLCPMCRDNYDRFLKEADMKFLDKAILGKEKEYEEEIDLYKTYGGD